MDAQCITFLSSIKTTVGLRQLYPTTFRYSLNVNENLQVNPPVNVYTCIDSRRVSQHTPTDQTVQVLTLRSIISPLDAHWTRA